jgi:glycosyltransferase involved in cell wall biosynthesis
VTGLPSVTLVVPIFNEEGRIRRLLNSIRGQRYPQDRIEIVVPDGGSTDRSREICREYMCQIVANPHRDQESGKRIGCLAASGELHMYLDADMEWADDRCLEALVHPWLEHDDLASSFPRYVVDPRDPPLNRFLSRHPLYQDPLMRFLSTQIDETVVADRGSYQLCRFVQGRVPVVGVALYRTLFVREVIESWGASWQWSDVDFAIECAERTSGLVAYVPTAGIFHRSSLTWKLHLSKLRRNVRATYLPNVARRRALYARWDHRRDVARLGLWLVYANLIVPGFAVGLARAIKHRDLALLYEGWATTVGTDYVLFQFAVDPRGRAMLRRAVASLVGKGTS